jgi:hypothetical protein
MGRLSLPLSVNAGRNLDTIRRLKTRHYSAPSPCITSLPLPFSR